MIDHMRQIGMERHEHDRMNMTFDDPAKGLVEVCSGRNHFRNDLKQKAGVFREMAWKNADLFSRYF